MMSASVSESDRPSVVREGSARRERLLSGSTVFQLNRTLSEVSMASEDHINSMLRTVRSSFLLEENPYENGDSFVDGSIENKIEQALDLVKSHLMFAVREELLSLTAELEQLTRRKEQLENENRFLIKYASKQTIANLQKINHRDSVFYLVE